MGTTKTATGTIQQVLRRFGYSRLKRADKGVVVRYLVRTPGYSRQQITRLIKRASAGVLKKAYRAPKRGPNPGSVGRARACRR